MPVIINNSLTADESKVRIVNPIVYIPDPKKKGPLSGAKMYFGLVGRDPLLEENQKKVYALQEDGSSTPMDQPIVCSAGGVPEYNGSPIQPAVAGSYSLAITDSSGSQAYYLPHVEALNFQGFNGVIAEEAQTVAGTLTLTYGVIEATTASFYISKDSLGTEFKGSYLQPVIDYTIVNATTITLTSAVPEGTVVIGRQMDPTGQIVPVSSGSSALFVYKDKAAVKIADLQIGDTLTLNGGIVSDDGLGGNRYETVAGGTGVDDNENFIDLNNGNQLKAIKNNLKLSRYAEVTTGTTTVSGTLTLDLNKGNVHKVTLTENISNLFFVNTNPDSTMTTTVTLKITQDSLSARTITYPSNIKWAGGTAPVMSVGLGAIDRYVFVTDDGGVSWHGAVMGQDFS